MSFLILLMNKLGAIFTAIQQQDETSDNVPEEGGRRRRKEEPSENIDSFEISESETESV